MNVITYPYRDISSAIQVEESHMFFSIICSITIEYWPWPIRFIDNKHAFWMITANGGLHDLYYEVIFGYTLTDFPISIRLTSLALWQYNDCPNASKATLVNMEKYFMWIHYERLHNHNKAKHNKTACIFLGIYCRLDKPASRLRHGLVITPMLNCSGPFY